MDAYEGGSNPPQGPGEPGAAPAAPQGSPPDTAPTAADRPADVSIHDDRESAHEPSPDPSHEPPHPSVPGPVSPATSPLPEPRTGVAALSLRYQIGVAVALAVVAVAVCAHVGMLFLHVAPSNTLTKQHGTAIDDWVYPEFEQNWKLFAPNPLQQNIAVQVRAQISTADGAIRTTGWYDLSARDGRAIDGNLLPSHTQQNELRRAWDYFVATHDSANHAVGLRGALSETYLRRIVALRLHRENAAGKGGTVELVQVRSRTTNVPPPKWSEERVSDQPVYRVLPWWSLPADETDGGMK